MASHTFSQAAGLATRSASPSARHAAGIDQRDREIALLKEELRIKDARMASIPAARRPQYDPCERLAILELKASRNWSLAQTARVFLVTAATIASWTKRIDEGGAAALLQTREPVNKFPDFVRHIVQRLQALCPSLGKVKIAEILARAGLHLAVSTVGRMRREPPVPEPQASPAQASTADVAAPTEQTPAAKPAAKGITAKHPNHVWHVDLTTMPIFGGACVPWLPFALPACFPFCWWLCVVLDHYSRRVVGVAVFACQPTAKQIVQFLGRVIAKVGEAPKHLISDQGSQFTSDALESWCTRRGIRQRFGAVGQHGSIGLVERFIRTLKENLRLWPVIALVRRTFLRDVTATIHWYNAERPHMSLNGATPDEVYFRRRKANQQPRFEPRAAWPRGSPCALPQVLVKGQPGVRLQMSVEYHAKQRHMPIVRITRAA